jgi:hypothetical protein
MKRRGHKLRRRYGHAHKHQRYESKVSGQLVYTTASLPGFVSFHLIPQGSVGFMPSRIFKKQYRKVRG